MGGESWAPAVAAAITRYLGSLPDADQVAVRRRLRQGSRLRFMTDCERSRFTAAHLYLVDIDGSSVLLMALRFESNPDGTVE